MDINARAVSMVSPALMVGVSGTVFSPKSKDSWLNDILSFCTWLMDQDTNKGIWVVGASALLERLSSIAFIYKLIFFTH